jgi:hypothetical protein
MTQEYAIAIASAARPQFGVPDTSRLSSTDRRIIEVVAGGPVRDGPPQPGPVLDRVAWIVKFAMEAGAAEFAVDEQTGSIIRFRHFRGSANEE